MATVLPFHRAIVRDPAFTAGDKDGKPAEGFDVHTRWIETEYDNQVEPFTAAGEGAEEEEPRQKIVVEVGGKRVEVSLPGDMSFGGGGGAGGKKKAAKRKVGGGSGAAASGDAVAAPMQGTIVKIAVEEGQTVAAGDLVVVLEAMKMENPVAAHKDGVITGLTGEPGTSVTQGTVICEIKDAE